MQRCGLPGNVRKGLGVVPSSVGWGSKLCPPDLFCALFQCICGDLWSNPLKYYRRKMAAVEGSEERIGEESLAGYWAEV